MADPATLPRDWRETLRNATDLALLGLISTVAALPVVTAGAAVATASAALHHWIEHDSWPGIRPVLHGFVRAVPAGAGATGVAALVATLLGNNLLVLHRGLVPGGTALIVVTALLTAAAGGLAGMTVVQVGRQGGRGWCTAARLAGRTALRRPAAPIASAGVLALTTTLGLLVLPPLTPVLAGYTLLALHAATRRIALHAANRRITLHAATRRIRRKRAAGRPRPASTAAATAGVQRLDRRRSSESGPAGHRSRRRAGTGPVPSEPTTSTTRVDRRLQLVEAVLAVGVQARRS